MQDTFSFIIIIFTFEKRPRDWHDTRANRYTIHICVQIWCVIKTRFCLKQHYVRGNTFGKYNYYAARAQHYTPLFDLFARCECGRRCHCRCCCCCCCARRARSVTPCQTLQSQIIMRAADRKSILNTFSAANRYEKEKFSFSAFETRDFSRANRFVRRSTKYLKFYGDVRWQT